MRPSKKAPSSSPRGGASPSGWHFIELARLCPYKFYLRHVLGLLPRFLPRELSFGGAFHAAKAAFYSGGGRNRLPRAVKAGLASLAASRPFYASDDAYQIDAARLGPLLEAWAAAFGVRDLEVFKILGVEIPVEVTLPSGRVFTGRLDAAVSPASEPGHVRILESKTTGWRADATIASVKFGGQARGYFLAAASAFSEASSIDLVPDVAFWKKDSLNPADISCVRGEPLKFPAPALRDFALGLDATLGEIGERVAAWEAGEPRAAVFPRAHAPGICCAYNRPCEYFEVCEAEIRPGESWDGFEWDEEILARARRAWAARVRKGGKR